VNQKNLLTPEMFADWLEHPVTQALRGQVLPAKRTELHIRWENGDYTAESNEGTMQLNAKAVAEAGVLRWFQELNFEQFIGELKDVDE
jgi:hypothetical protein